MRSMRKAFLISLLSVGFFWSSYAVNCEIDTQTLFRDANQNQNLLFGMDQYNGTLHSYVCNVQHCCLQQQAPGSTRLNIHSCLADGQWPLWNFTQEDQVIDKHDMTKYPDLSDSATDKSMETIRKTYVDTMNHVMNCTLTRMKYQMNNEIITGEALGETKLTESISVAFEQMNEYYLEQMDQMKCLEPTDNGDVKQYEPLMDSMMYEQCVYQYYMLYYGNAVKNAPGLALIGKDPRTVKEVSEAQLATIGNIVGERSISAEAMQKAVQMYTLIPQAYVPHALMDVMKVQLFEIRRHMAVTLHALKYLFSKADNAELAA